MIIYYDNINLLRGRKLSIINRFFFFQTVVELIMVKKKSVKQLKLFVFIIYNWDELLYKAIFVQTTLPELLGEGVILERMYPT